MTFREMLQKLEEFAFGEIGLTPFDFYRMTMLEFEHLKTGYDKKTKAQNEFRAYLISWVVNSSGNVKKAIGVEDILPSVNVDNKIPSNKILDSKDREDMMKVIRKRRLK